MVSFVWTYWVEVPLRNQVGYSVAKERTGMLREETLLVNVAGREVEIGARETPYPKTHATGRAKGQPGMFVQGV